MKRTFTLGFLSVVFMFFIPSYVIFAATSALTGVANVLPSECSTSNNIQVSLTKGTEQIVAGKDITISGSLTNNNSYPIPDVSLSARLVKLAKNYGSSYDTVTDTVFWSNPIFGSYVGANSKSNFSFTIRAPLGLIPGPYLVEIFLDGSSQFAVGGTEYSGVPAAVYPLTISSDQTQTSFFDTSSIKVNGVAPYQRAVLTPYDGFDMATTSIMSLSSISVTHIATTSISIINTYSTSSTATISWSLFKGDFTDNAKNLVTTKTNQVTLLPGKKTVVSFASGNIVDARYTLVGILNSGNKFSIFSVLIYRSDINEPFAQSLHLDSFPTVSQNNFVSGCLVKNSFATTTASLSLTDASGATVWSSNLSMSTSSPFIGFHLPLTLASNKSQSLNLSLKTFDASGNIVSSSSVSYVCSSTNCPHLLWSTILLYVIIVLIVLVLIFAIIYLKKRKSFTP